MVNKLKDKILAGDQITPAEAMPLTALSGSQVYELLHVAWQVTDHFLGASVDLCSIINAKSGRCSEDCQFCAQSSYFQTEVDDYPLLDLEKILDRAQEMEAAGANRFSLVISGRGPDQADFTRILKIFRVLKRETGLGLCASLGIINEEQAAQLAEVGVTTYHHNLETGRSYFPFICTTHTYDERVQTIQAARKAGLHVCSGGILSLGESWANRVELAFELRELQVDSVPLNILNPLKGTPLAHLKPMKPLEVLKTIAIFRLILPQTELRLCGGREPALRSLQPLAFSAGINALLVGNYLTTAGRTVTEDVQTLIDLGLKVRRP
ncbi:MAG: biotin synthase BioB [Syntrophomonadaceae bacterium]|nr:biotin synthase BioB [Syntrophomonadaceae bacterium]